MATDLTPADTDVQFFRAADGRTVAIHVPASFDQYEAFPPYLDTEEEQEHLEEAYDVESIEQERRTKAHITADEFPLQIILLRRPEGSFTGAHYHEITGRTDMPTRHQILLCQSGGSAVGVYTEEGGHLGDVDLEPGDLILMLEGHSVEFSEPDTKLIEIKQGPFPETDENDKVDLDVD
jgi:hypothetical protein